LKKEVKTYIIPELRELVTRANDIPQPYEELPGEKADRKYMGTDKYYYLRGLK